MADTPMRCDNCAHWGIADSSKVSGIALRACSAVPYLQDAIDADRRIKPEFADSLAFAEDAEMYWAHLLTAAGFGCVNFKRAP